MRQRSFFNKAVKQLLDEQAAAAAAPPATNEERVRQVRESMLRMLLNRGPIPGLPNGVASQDMTIGGSLPVRLFLPPDQTPGAPVLVYLHGGGWVAGSVEAFDPFCRLLSGAARIPILSVEYRLAPEHPFPDALDDAMTAVEWMRSRAEEYGVNSGRILIGGDSAGGNLAAVTGNTLCAEGRAAWLTGLLMLYPVLDHPSAGHQSYEENRSGYGLEAERMHWFWTQYAADERANDPRLSPLRRAALPGLPPTLIATADYDVLRDEGLAYASKLRASGVPVTHLHSPDMPHNFPATPNLVARFPECLETLDQIASWLHARTIAPDAD